MAAGHVQRPNRPTHQSLQSQRREAGPPHGTGRAAFNICRTATTATRSIRSPDARSRRCSCRRITRPAPGGHRQRLRRPGTMTGARRNHPGRGSPGQPCSLSATSTTRATADRTGGHDRPGGDPHERRPAAGPRRRRPAAGPGMAQRTRPERKKGHRQRREQPGPPPRQGGNDYRTSWDAPATTTQTGQ